MNLEAILSRFDRNSTANVLVPAFVALFFFLMIVLFHPFREKLQYDVDEGFNLMRSMLVTMDYSLYDEVSSDQPPLFTYLLAGLQRLTGYRVNPGRIMVLLFATLLVWSCTQFTQLTWGSLHAVLVGLTLLLLPYFLQLSVSIMIGLPAISLAALSMLLLAIWHLKGDDYWLVLSGAVLGLSVLTKLFTGILAPVFLVGVTAAQFTRLDSRKISLLILKPGLIWGASFGTIIFMMGAIMVGPANLADIVRPHLEFAARQLEAGENTIDFHLQTALPFLFLALSGVLLTIHSRRWLNLYPFAWALAAYTAFRSYSPVWYHHQLLVTVPAAILAGAAVGESLLWIVRLPRGDKFSGFKTVLAVVTLLVFGFGVGKSFRATLEQLSGSPRFSGVETQAPLQKLRLYRKMLEYAPDTRWVVTDMPIYAYLIERPVPPALATFSGMRLLDGSLSEDQILEAVEQYKPEQVLMVFFELPRLEMYLREHYELVYDKGDYSLFLRNDP